jgi:hypothetical protein
MNRKTKTMTAAVIVVAIVMISGVLFFTLSEKDKRVGIVNVPLNTLNLSVDELLDGYILNTTVYNDDPGVQHGIRALETYGVIFNSEENGSNDSIFVALIKFNSSFDAQEDLFYSIPDYSLTVIGRPIYAEPAEQIGDESILNAYCGESISSLLTKDNPNFNETSVVLFFRIKNIVGFVVKNVKNIDMSDIDFIHSTIYKNYCESVYEYAKSIEGEINSHIVFIKGEEPSGKVLELKEIKSESTGKTVVMSAEEYMDDLLKSNISGFRGMFSFHVLDAGDTLILKDNISNIVYEPLYNDTFVSLQSSDWRPLYLFIQGNITDKYDMGNEVEIALHIIEVNFSYLGEDYSVKIIGEGWKNLNYYLYYQTIIDTIDIVLPQSYIQKV